MSVTLSNLLLLVQVINVDDYLSKSQLFECT